MMVRRIGGGVLGPRSGGRGVLPSGVVANPSSQVASLPRGRSLETSGVVSSGGSREESPEEGRTGKLDQLYSIR